MRHSLGLAELRTLFAMLIGGFLAFSRPPRWLELDGQLALPSQGRVVIVAPHNDDEVLAAGGLMQVALAAGLDVQVLFLTNGDGFPIAAAQVAGRLRPGPADFERLGALRQQESLAALAVLGVPMENVSFLGFPDGGLADLWQHYWGPGRPYRSRYTSRTASRGEINASTGSGDGAKGSGERPYAGHTVVQELAALLRAWQPQLIVLPHPADAHADHWATYNFTTYTLAALRRAGEAWVDEVEAWHYVVHRGDWPAPKGYKPEARLLPPPGLLTFGPEWQLLPLTEREIERKTEAIRTYRSQVSLMPRFLFSFARSNELFARVPPLLVPMLVLGERAQPHPDELGVALRQPSQDTLARKLEPAADLTEVRVGQTNDGIWLFARMRGKRGVGIRYRLMLRAIDGSSDAPAWRLEWSKNRAATLLPLSEQTPPRGPQPTVHQVADGWLIYVAKELLGAATAFMAGIQSHGPGGVLIGHTGWPLLMLNRP